MNRTVARRANPLVVSAVLVIATILAGVPSTSTAAQGSCITITKRTSVDFSGPEIQTTCRELSGAPSSVFKKEKNKCERRRKSVWKDAKCPEKDLLATCQISKMGPVSLPFPMVTHHYEFQGGNLSRDQAVNLLARQCQTMGLGAGKLTVY